MNESADHPQSIVLLAHGSGDPAWRRPLERLQRILAAQAPGRAVSLAYLQLASPTLVEALQSCGEAGARRVTVVPVFLSGGGHLLRDVPQIVARAAAQVDRLEVRCAGALGEEPEVLEGMAAACLRMLER